MLRLAMMLLILSFLVTPAIQADTQKLGIDVFHSVVNSMNILNSERR